MEKLFVWAVLACVLLSLWTGRAEAAAGALLDCGSAAVALALTLAGAYCLWCGVLEVMERAGLNARLARALRPLLRRLFPGLPAGGQAESAIATNFAANLLGMGNAATPAGLQAMEALRRCASAAEPLPTDNMCLFLILNSSSLQLAPTTLISLRAAAGSQAPADIFLPCLLASLGSTLCAWLCTLAWRKLRSAWGRRRPARK